MRTWGWKYHPPVSRRRRYVEIWVDLKFDATLGFPGEGPRRSAERLAEKLAEVRTMDAFMLQLGPTRTHTFKQAFETDSDFAAHAARWKRSNENHKQFADYCKTRLAAVEAQLEPSPHRQPEVPLNDRANFRLVPYQERPPLVDPGPPPIMGDFQQAMDALQALAPFKWWLLAGLFILFPDQMTDLMEVMITQFLVTVQSSLNKITATLLATQRRRKYTHTDSDTGPRLTTQRPLVINSFSA